MSIEQQRATKDAAYEEAMLYMENARETYRKARKQNRYYTYRKYVRGGGHYAYLAVLIALDALLKAKGIDKAGRKDIDYYRRNIGAIDRKLLTALNAAYDTLHLAAAYDGNLTVDVNQSGLKTADEIIERLKD